MRVAVLGIAGRVETAMPLLCTVAASYIGSDTKMETKIEILQNDPRVVSVRETAIKALDGKAAATPPATPPNPTLAPTTPAPPPGGSAGGKPAPAPAPR